MPGRSKFQALTLSRARAAFLLSLSKTGQITRSAKAAKVERQTVYNWRKEDPEFAKQWDAALELAADMLEDVAFQRATRPTNPSDGLLTLLLKAHKDKYRDRSTVELTGALEISQKLQKARERADGSA